VAGDDVDVERFEHSLRETTQEPCTHVVVHRGRRLAVGYQAYAGYPVRVIRGAGCVAVYEGSFYGRDRELDAQLVALTGLFSADQRGARAAVERFAAQADGDFNLLLFDESSDQAIFVNDALARLPVFYRQASSSFALAREIKFLHAWGGRPEPDRVAIAQALMFGWCLGARTVESGVLRLLDGSSVEMNDAGAHVHRYHTWNFDDYAHGGKPYDSPSELAAFFVDRCATLAARSARPVLVSLSGGLDSRTVAAGLARANTPFTGVTFAHADNANQADVDIAKQVAEVLEVPWLLYPLEEEPWESSEQLVRLRDGLCYTGVTYMLGFLARVRFDFPDAAYLTGDGGDKTLAEFTYPPLAGNLDAFVDAITSNTIWPPAQASAFVGIGERQLVESVHDQFAQYPERSPDGRRARFCHTEHAWRWLFEGEERNRTFLWSTTPFYAQSFFRRALAVPAAHKRRFRYYAQFVRALNAAVAAIPNANWGAPVGSPRALMRGLLQGAAVRMPRTIKNAIRRRVLSFHSEADVGAGALQRLAALQERLAQGGVFAISLTKAALDAGCSRLQYEMLLTQLLYQDSREMSLI
jgi:asparagine synthase (glutamine-hydrolysing)